MKDPIELVQHGPVIPVIVIQRLQDAVPLARSLVAGGVRVLEVLPPVVETKMTAGLTSGKLPVAECARQIVSAIGRDAEQANVGMVKLLRAVYSVSPALARSLMIRF